MSTSAHDAENAVITLTGDVTLEDLPQLRLALVTAVDRTPPETDLLIDAHGVTGFADDCLMALVTARSRAKWHRQSLAVLAGVGSPLEACLRRSGHLGRIAVYDDVASAREALRLHRASRRGSLGLDRAG